MDPTKQLYLRLARLLIERGFATAHIADMKCGLARFTWTRRGRELRRHLLRLFAVPDLPVESHSHDYIVAIISLILFTGESRKPRMLL